MRQNDISDVVYKYSMYDSDYTRRLDSPIVLHPISVSGIPADIRFSLWRGFYEYSAVPFKRGQFSPKSPQQTPRLY